MCLGDTGALCDDMRDFAHDYIDYSNMAKQLIPEMNTVQHWSKIIETKYVSLLYHVVQACFLEQNNNAPFLPGTILRI